jgi:hypothetical protein
VGGRDHGGGKGEMVRRPELLPLAGCRRGQGQGTQLIPPPARHRSPPRIWGGDTARRNREGTGHGGGGGGASGAAAAAQVGRQRREDEGGGAGHARRLGEGRDWARPLGFSGWGCLLYLSGKKKTNGRDCCETPSDGR